MKRFSKTLVWAVALVLIFSLVGCGSSNTPASSSATGVSSTANVEKETEQQTQPAEKVELDFAMVAFANEIPGWTAMIDAANKELAEQNISVKITKVPAQNWQEYYQKIVVQMAAGTAPDIGRMAESQMPMVIAKGQAVDLTEYVKELDMSKYYEPPFHASSYKDGHIYGVPSGIYCMLLYYNKDLFDKAGVPYLSSDWNNAVTLDQIMEAAKKLTSGEGAKKVFGYSSKPWLGGVGALSLSAGGKNIFNDDGTSALKSPETISVFQWFDKMFKAKLMPMPTDTNVMNASDMFKAGRIAIINDGSWMHNVYKQINTFKVGIATTPTIKSGRSYTPGFVDAFLVIKGTKHEKEAWEAIKAIISKEGFDALAPSGTGGIPVQKETLAALKDSLVGEKFTPEEKDCFTNSLDFYSRVPYNENFERIDINIDQMSSEWILGKMTIDEFVNYADEMINKEINQK